MQHVILFADSVNSCAMVSALDRHLSQEGGHSTPTARDVEDTPSNSLIKHHHFHFKLLITRSFTLLYIKDFSVAGTNQCSNELQAYARKVLEQRLDELSTHHPNAIVSVIVMTEQSTTHQSDQAQVLVLGQQAPPTDVAVTGVSGMIYDWCHFNRSRYATLQALQCAVVLLRHPGAPVYPYSEYAELYLSTPLLKAIAIPSRRELYKTIREIVQTHMNAISLVYI